VSTIDEAIRSQLLDGLPPLVQGIAEGVIVEWERAVSAVPELERLAAEDLGGLMEMDPAEREEALRRRWDRLNHVPDFELIGRSRRAPVAGVGRIVAAR
jgi:hypothetical protein